MIFRRPATARKAPKTDAIDATDLRRVDERAVVERTLLGLLPDVRRWLYRMLGPSSALDDATQDALIAIANALPTLASADKLQAFARTITTRVAYTYFARVETVAFQPERHAVDAPLADAVLAERRALDRLYRCLAKLPAKRRVAFVLCGIEGLSHAEAALLERTSEASMRARYMHARHDLMRMLGSAPEETSHG